MTKMLFSLNLCCIVQLSLSSRLFASKKSFVGDKMEMSDQKYFTTLVCPHTIDLFPQDMFFAIDDRYFYRMGHFLHEECRV